jgi:hypothetical protein
MSPSGLPAAGYPASARWHVFRPQVSATRNDCKAASAAFATDQLLMPAPSDADSSDERPPSRLGPRTLPRCLVVVEIQLPSIREDS